MYLMSIKLSDTGVLPRQPWDTLTMEELGQTLDPDSRSKPEPSIKVGNSGLLFK